MDLLRACLKGFYNFAALGGATPLPSRGLFDYLDYPVDQEGRAGGPLSWGGMSGSGLWQIQVKRDGDSLAPARPLLFGIVFYQNPTTETSCGVRAHGRESVYRIAYDRIGASPMK